MNKIISTIVTLSILLFQFVSVQSNSIKSTGKSSGTSSLYKEDWTGERLQLIISRDQNNDTERFVAISVNNDATAVNFNCSRRRQIKLDGPVTTISYAEDKVTLINGSAIYLNEDSKPWCSWTIKLEDNSTFPMKLIKPVELIVHPTEYQVIIHLNETLPIASGDFSSLSSQLIQQFSDYKVIGNSRYQLFSRSSDQVNFALVVNYTNEVKQLFPKVVTINLLNSPYGLTIQCNFTSSQVVGHLMFAERPFWTSLSSGYNYQLSNNQIINGTICQWSIPNQIEFRDNGFLPVPTRTYNLTVVADKRFVVFNKLDFTL